MTQIVVNRLIANVSDLRPDLFSLFAETVAKIEDADAAGCDTTRDIGYATVDAILEAAVEVVPRDIENVLHRLGCANYLLDVLYDHASRGLEIDDVIKKISSLLTGTACGLSEAYEIDMHATRLDFYLPRQAAQQN